MCKIINAIINNHNGLWIGNHNIDIHGIYCHRIYSSNNIFGCIHIINGHIWYCYFYKGKYSVFSVDLSNPDGIDQLDKILKKQIIYRNRQLRISYIIGLIAFCVTTIVSQLIIKLTSIHD